MNFDRFAGLLLVGTSLLGCEWLSPDPDSSYNPQGGANQGAGGSGGVSPTGSGAETSSGGASTGGASTGGASTGGASTGGAGGGGGGGGGGANPNLGIVTASPQPCTITSALQGATCERMVVSGCSDLEDSTVQVIIAEATSAPFRGTVFFGSGSAGATPMEQAGGPNFVAALEYLRGQGFRVVERAWQGGQGDRGWLRGTKGPFVSACRYATLLTELSDRFDAEGQLCAVGFSGGSMELGMVMSRWGLGDRLDFAAFESGPTASFADACIANQAWSDECASLTMTQPWDCSEAPACLLGENIACLIDGSYGANPANGQDCDPNVKVCAAHDAAFAATLQADSVLVAGAQVDFPSTRLAALFGMQDCASGAAMHGLDFADQLSGKGGSAVSVVLEPTSGHTVHATAAGAAALRDLVEQGCGVAD